MGHAGGDGSHSGVASVLAAWTMVTPDRNRLIGSLTEPGAASVHSHVVGHAGAAVACTAAPAIVGPMVTPWKEASHRSKLTTARQHLIEYNSNEICRRFYFATCPISPTVSVRLVDIYYQQKGSGG